MTYNSADAFVPNLMRPQASLPNYKQLTDIDWVKTKEYEDAPTWNTPPTFQSDNYRNENEQYQTNGIRMYDMPTGEEPTYGHRKTDMNQFLNNNGKVNTPAQNIFAQTRILQPYTDARWLYKLTSQYPQSDPMDDFIGGGSLL